MIAPALLMACGPAKVRPPATAGDTTGDTAVVTPTEPQTTGGPDARTFVAPSVRILETPGLDVLNRVALLPAHGTDAGVILVYAWSDAFGDERYDSPRALAVRGDLSAGDHAITSVWDGVSMISESWPWDAVVNAGDVDRDGHLDLWYGQRLLRGPLLKGRELDTTAGDVLATLDGGREYAVAGNFDADSDGELDVIAQVASGQQAFVRYGPFSGSIPSAYEGDADAATFSSLGEGTGCQAEMTSQWLRDHLGPGHDAVAIGVDLDLCGNDTLLWDPFVPRGTHLRYDQAFAVLTHFANQFGDVFVHDPGDVDRDGYPDVIYEVQNNAQLIPGALDGLYDTSTDFGFWDQMLNGFPQRAMGDVNGDGAPEILGRWYWTEPGSTVATHDTWVLMCSPFTFPLDFSTGLPLVESHGGPWVMSSFIGVDSVDLDGDGLHDLVDTRAQQEPEGLSIWYGKDLSAACAAHSTSML